MDHETYLRTILRDKKLELERLQMKQQVSMAIFETRSDSLLNDIDSLELQLSNGEKTK